MSWMFFLLFFSVWCIWVRVQATIAIPNSEFSYNLHAWKQTNVCCYKHVSVCLWMIALTVSNLIFIVQQFLFFSQGSRSPWLCWEQFLHRPDTNRILLPHHGWPWGSGGHCRQDCRHRLHAAPSGQGRLPWSVRLRLGKRVVDTAVKTADMGYMHRHLVKVDCCDQSGYG